MIRKITVFVFAIALTFSVCSADTEAVSSDRTTVVNNLPEATAYIDNVKEYDYEKVSVRVDGVKAKVTEADNYENIHSGMNYYIMVDVSASISDDSMSDIKHALKSFCSETLTGEDTVYIIPIGSENSIKSDTAGYAADSDEIQSEIDALQTGAKKSYVYQAIEQVAGNIEENNPYQDRNSQRNVVLLFTDGVENTNGGSTQKDKAADALSRQGTALFAFAVDDERDETAKQSRDNLKQISDRLKGVLYTGDILTGLNILHDELENALTINFTIGNSGDLGESFDVEIASEEFERDISITDISKYNPKDKGSSFAYTLKKLFGSFWWIIFIAAIALIAFFVIRIIKNHKGIIKVDGQTVFRDNVSQRAHVSVNKLNSVSVRFMISIQGSRTIVHQIELVESIIVGRSKECDLSLDDSAMGRQHFAIEYTGENLYLMDLESQNGTFLNGVRVTSKQRLNQRDKISAGRSRITIEWDL